MNNVLDLKFSSIEFGDINLNDYSGKIIMIVNTASKCGFANQYKHLEELYLEYGPKLVIIGVPSLDFKKQEFNETSETICFIREKMEVTFPISSVTKVIGDNSHPFFKWIREQTGKELMPKWNFYKFIISPDGSLYSHYSSMTAVKSKKIINDINTLIKTFNL